MAAAYFAAASVFAAAPRLLTRVPLAVLAAAAIVGVAVGVGAIAFGISVFPWSDLVVAAFALAAGTWAGRALPPRRRPMAVVLAILAVLDSAQVFAAGPATPPPSPFRQWTMFIVPGAAGSAIGFADLAIIAMIGEHWRRRGGNVLLSTAPGVVGLALALGFVALGIRGGIPLVPFLLAGWAIRGGGGVSSLKRCAPSRNPAFTSLICLRWRVPSPPEGVPLATTERRRLQESEARVRALIDSITDYAIFLLDESGRVTTWSPGAELIKGYREHEIIDRHFSVFYLPEDVSAGKPERGLEIAARDGRFQDEGWRVRKDGSRFMADVVITPVRDDDGELLGYAKVTRDVTAHHLERERAALLRAVEERQRIAARIHSTAITLLFEVGMELQGLAVRADDAKFRVRLEAAVSKLDDAIRQLRSLVFHPETTPSVH